VAAINGEHFPRHPLAARMTAFAVRQKISGKLADRQAICVRPKATYGKLALNADPKAIGFPLGRELLSMARACPGHPIDGPRCTGFPVRTDPSPLSDRRH
jgi:hypothetical protein